VKIAAYLFWIGRTISASALCLLAACTFDVDGKRNSTEAKMPAMACTREYKPVCAQHNGIQETFANACTARRHGYLPIRAGRCRPDASGSSRSPKMCPMIYAPVCAAKAGDRRTFGNRCSAEADGYRVVHNGAC